MAKAQINLADGISVKVDGTPEEIAAVLARLGAKSEKQTPGMASPAPKGTTVRAPKGGKQRLQLTDLVGTLIDGGFFKKPKDLASVKVALAEMGHHYPVTTLSATMLRQVRKRNLRRIKQEKRWMYTG